jgi:hypothetical protein
VTDPQVCLPAPAHPSPAVRESAAVFFQQVGERAEPYAADLAKLLGDPDDDVRRRAVRAFQAIGAAGVPHLHRIRRGTADPRPAAPAATPASRPTRPASARTPWCRGVRCRH